MEHLLKLYAAGLEAMRHVEIVQEDARMMVEEATLAAKRAISDYHRALAAENAKQRVPSGHCLDVLGDGQVKPVGECAKDVARNQ